MPVRAQAFGRRLIGKPPLVTPSGMLARVSEFDPSSVRTQDAGVIGLERLSGFHLIGL